VTNRWILAAAAISVTVALAGCDDGSSKADPGRQTTSPSATPAATPSTPEQRADVAARQAVDAYLEVLYGLYADPKGDIKELDSVAIARARAEAEMRIKAWRADDKLLRGAPKTISITTKGFHLADDPPTVELAVCADTSSAETLQGGTPFTPPAGTTARTLTRYGVSESPKDGIWRVSWYELGGKNAC